MTRSTGESVAFVATDLATDAATRPGTRRRWAMLIAGAVVALAAVGIGARYYLWALHHESTDDAFIDGHIVHVAPQVAGRVHRVLVTDKRTEPAPDAAFKVGESSVEVGAHYYREVVGMRDHLEKLSNYVGTLCTINMKHDDHHGCTPDGYVLVLFKNGKFVLER